MFNRERIENVIVNGTHQIAGRILGMYNKDVDDMDSDCGADYSYDTDSYPDMGCYEPPQVKHRRPSPVSNYICEVGMYSVNYDEEDKAIHVNGKATLSGNQGSTDYSQIKYVDFSFDVVEDEPVLCSLRIAPIES